MLSNDFLAYNAVKLSTYPPQLSTVIILLLLAVVSLKPNQAQIPDFDVSKQNILVYLSVAVETKFVPKL